MKKLFLILAALTIWASASAQKAADEPQKPSLVGTRFKEIATIPSASGKAIKLSDVVAANRYTLLDFWASWCRPCMGEVPHLKAAYDEWHPKGFEIFGVSYDNDALAWQGAISKNGMSWVHVSSLDGWKCPTQKLYGVTSIPANYLIDSQGCIVAHDLRGEDLATKLAELLK